MTLHVDPFRKDLLPENPALLAANTGLRTCPAELAFHASRKPIPLHYPLETKLLRLMEQILQCRATKMTADSRALSRNSLRRQTMAQGWTSGASRGLQTDSIEQARLQQLVLTLLSVKKIERKSLKAKNAATGQV